jgi:hypothetical protein
MFAVLTICAMRRRMARISHGRRLAPLSRADAPTWWSPPFDSSGPAAIYCAVFTRAGRGDAARLHESALTEGLVCSL